jgi:predicted ATPase
MIRGDTPAPSGTSFVGRERELAALAQAVREERLLTLHGPGGAGKTRLAVELIDRIAPESALFADLGPLARGSAVWSSLAQLVDAREEPGVGPADAAVDALVGQDLMLVLDNCEHVLDSAREVADRVLDECAGVTVLATSREPLGLPVETVWPVPPLSVPPETAGLAEAVEHDAGRLFAERVARALPGLSMRDEDAAGVVQICRRLDGIPLAIELAAARIKVMGPAEIAERLDDRFRLLAREDAAGPRRHRTLRALVDWSYELLVPEERLMLARLSLFAGGFELDAVESVCPGDGVRDDEIVDLLTGLVDKALVNRGARGSHARFRLHETIREYAAERLATEDDPEALSARHLDWCRTLAATADDAWLGEGGPAWLDRARAEQDNVRQALRWGLRSGHGEEALGLAWRFANFWSHWGRAEEADTWLERCLEATDQSPPSVDRARALTRAGGFAWLNGRLSRAREQYEGALAIGEELDDQVRKGVALLSLADLDRTQGRLADARRSAEEGLNAIEQSGDRERIRWLVEALARIDLAEGDVESARERFQTSRAEAMALGNEIALAITVGQLGETEREAGDRAAARMHLEEALGLARRTDDREAEGAALLSLGRLELDGDDTSEARSKLTAALRVAEDAGVRAVALQCLDILANAKVEAGDARGGARLLGAVEAIREALGTPPEPRELARLEHVHTVLEDALDPEPLAAELGAGRACSWSEAVGEGLRSAEPAIADQAQTAEATIEVVLHRSGEMWVISRPGHEVLLRDSKGIRYLAELIGAGGRELHVLDLAGARLEQVGSELLDDTARLAYRQRLAELEAELDEAERFRDPERIRRASDERDSLQAELAAALGLGGRPRRTPSSAERARKAVTNRIRDALARIEREDPELGEHLRRSVRMGTECAYRSEPRSPWSLQVA